MPLNVVAKIAITAAMTALNMAVQASTNLGDRNKIDDLAVTQGDYGASIARIWGARRIEGAPIFWANPLTEIKRRRKTKGGKYNDYSYFGDWAVAAACHEISGVTRIWFDKHLVYDATGSGPITALTSNSGFVLSEHIRFYLGTETQDADPYMLASVEAAQGAGTCPAYRGTAYVMFEQIPLEKFGNRIPQVTLEVAGAVTTIYPYQRIETGLGTTMFPRVGAFSPDFSRFYWTDDTDLEIWDVPSRTLISNVNLSTNFYASDTVAIGSDLSIWGVSTTNNELIKYGELGLGAPTEVFDFGGELQNEVRVISDGNGNQHWFTLSFLSGTILPFVDGVETDFADTTGYPVTPCDYFADQYGDIWVFGKKDNTTAVFIRLVDTEARPGSASIVEVTGLSSSAGAGQVDAAMHYLDATHDQFVFSWNNARLYAADIEAGTVLDSIVKATTANQILNVRPGAPSLFSGGDEIALSDFTVLRTYDLTDWLATETGAALYDPVNHAIISAANTDSITVWRYLDRFSGDAVSLQTICNDASDLCGISDYSFSAFSSIMVDGWSVTGATGADMVQPLLDIYDCDIRPHDFGVQGVVRGGASGGTIDYLDFVPVEGNRYSVKIAQSAEMPRAMVLNFADLDNDQQVNSVRASRPTDIADTDAEVTIDMTNWVADADTAQQALDRYFRRRWNEREVITTGLTGRNISLEPADLRTLGLETDDRLCRLVRAKWGAGVLTGEWISDDANLHLLSGNAGPGFDGRLPETITVPGPVRGFVLDVNLATDAHDSAVPFLYYAAGPYGSSFAGADFAVSDSGVDADFVDGWAAVPADGAASWGLATAALGDALPWIMDNGNSINVLMKSGEPSVSVTEAQLLADADLNLISMNGEWIQYQTRTLESDDSYTLTGLLRGRRGTEHLIDGHTAGEAVLFTGLYRRDIGAGEINDTDLYRASAVGRDSTYQTSVTFGAAANKPYSAVNGVLTLDTGTDDWSISADRRTRVGGTAFLAGNLPLGETSESWQADIMDGADVVRTISGTSLPLTYTAAQQVTDFGVEQTALEVNLYQISPALSLRGYPLNIAA